MEEKIQIYSVGLVYLSVCVPKEMSKERIEELVNAERATGISSDWEVSDETFASGDPNPYPCSTCPDDRLHYLMNC